jgi:hypothetical protein
MGIFRLLQGLFPRSKPAYPAGSIAVPLGIAIMGRADVTRQRIMEETLIDQDLAGRADPNATEAIMVIT